MYDKDLTEDEVQKALELIEAIQESYTLIESETCIACAGSGHYDNHNSPKCDGCNGHGNSPVDITLVMRTSLDLQDLYELSQQDAKSLCEKIDAYMSRIGLGWSGEHYFTDLF